MKLTKEELIKKISESAIEDDKKIELLEDVSDSFEVEEKREEINLDDYVAKADYEELKRKYIERFNGPAQQVAEEPEEVVEEEKKDITIEDLFVEEKD